MWKRLLASLVAGVVILSSGGCALRQTPSPGDTTAPGEPRYGGTLRRPSIYGDPENLDPILKDKLAALMVTMNLFDGLVRMNHETLEIESAIAKNWTISPDGTVYTFHLRDDVKFHNGRKVTAQEFKYSFERLADPVNKSPLSGWLAPVVGIEEFKDKKAPGIAGIEVVDPHTLRITLQTATYTFLRDLTAVAASVVPKEEVEKLGLEFGHRPVGTGPFKFVKWVKDSVVVIEANHNYFEGRPYLDRVETLVMPEAGTRDAEFAAGNLDYMLLGDPQYRLYRNDPKWQPYLIEVAELYTRHMAFNVSKPPFNDPRVRQAINHAIDRHAIVEHVLAGKAYPAEGILPSSHIAFDPTLKGYEFNPEKAKKLLREAGYERGFEFECLGTNHPAWGVPAIEAVQPYLEAVGIKVKPVLVEWGVMMEQSGEGKFDAYMYSTNGSPDPVGFLIQFHSDYIGHAGNRMRYSNPEFDRLLNEAMAKTDMKEIVRLARDAERILLAETPWWIFNYNKAVILRQPWVHGLIAAPTDMDYQPLHKVWLSPH